MVSSQRRAKLSKTNVDFSRPLLALPGRREPAETPLERVWPCRSSQRNDWKQKVEEKLAKGQEADAVPLPCNNADPFRDHAR